MSYDSPNMACKFTVSVVLLFLSSHVATCINDNKEQIFTEIIANYDENSNNVRTFCAGGTCPREGREGDQGARAGEGRKEGQDVWAGEKTTNEKKRVGKPSVIAVKRVQGGKVQVGKVQQEDPGKVAACSAEDEEDCSLEVDPSDRDSHITMRPHTVDVHKYQARHQRLHLFSKATDDALGRVRLPTSARKVRRGMKHCALEISKNTITPEAADKRAPSAPKQEALRQNVRTVEDRHRMEALLQAWPSNKPKGAIYLIVTAARSHLLKGESLSLSISLLS